MKTTEQLEPQQYGRMYWESDVPMKDLRVGMLQKVLFFLGVLFVALIAMAATIRFPDQLELPVVLKSERQNNVYTFPFTIYIAHRYVNTGDTVRVNQRLMTITSPEIVQLIHDLNTQQAKEKNFNRADKIGYQKQRDMVRSSIAQNEVQIRGLTAQLELLAQNWQVDKQKLTYELADAKEKLDRNKPLFDGKIIAQVEWRQYEINHLKAQTSLATAQIAYTNKQATLRTQIAELQLTKTSSNSNTDKIRADEQSTEFQLKSDSDNTRQMVENLFGNYEIDKGSIIVKSKMNGQIAYLFDGEQEVKASVMLLKISTQHSPTYGFIKCPPSVVGKIHRNQDCYLKVASFPFYEWGTLKGKTTEISAAPDEKGEFNVKVDFATNTPMQPLLQTGLTGQAVIIIDNKTLLSYFFRSTTKNYHQFTKGDFIETTPR